MLHVKKLSKVYSDGTKALNTIDLQLPTGMVGLLGPNGAGKSTLLRILASIQAPTSGEITFGDIDTIKHPHLLRATLGYLPQYFGVYPNMTCLSLLNYLAVLKGISNKEQRKKQIQNLLDITNLSQFATKKVTQFSGGMRQRFGIAQALLGDPKLVIMDEPTAGLDPAERDRLHDLLVNISKNKLILLSTHIVEDIENLCQHVALIDRGNIIDSAPIRNLITPLEGKVWLTNNKPQPDTLIINKSYRYGAPHYRVYATSQPSKCAERVKPTLQDRYFFELISKSSIQ